MSKYGRLKEAWFEDGVILSAYRRAELKRAIRVRREVEGYRGRVYFRNGNAWWEAYTAYLNREYDEANYPWL